VTKVYVTKNLVCNLDGTVTYWSVSRQQWVYRERTIHEKDLDAMPPNDRNRALFHLNGDRLSMMDYSM
jgi:hypothetical protein